MPGRTPTEPKLNDRDVLSLMTGQLGSLLSSGLVDGITLVLAVKKFQDQGMEYLDFILNTLPKMEGQFEGLVEEHLAKKGEPD